MICTTKTHNFKMKVPVLMLPSLRYQMDIMSQLTLAGMLEVCGGGPNPTPAAAAFCKARRCARSLLSSSPDFKADSWSQGSACTDNDMIVNIFQVCFVFDLVIALYHGIRQR